MVLRSGTIAAKFALALFITRYLGLAELGVYGIFVSIAAMAPVLLGFGVSNNLGRDAARKGPESIALPLLQYFLFLVPIYGALCAVGIFVWPGHLYLMCLLAPLLLLENIQSDMFTIMTISGSAYEANIMYFVRFAGWALVYVPAAALAPSLRNLTDVVLFWLLGCLVACVLSVVFTRRWRWGEAIRALPRARIRLPHASGSTPLYVGDMANTGFQYLDRYIVGLFLSPTVLGVYVLYWSITNALSNLITISVVQIEMGVLVRVAEKSGRAFSPSLWRVSLMCSAMAVVLGGLATVMMYLVVPHLGRPEAVGYLPLMILLCAALVLRTFYEVIGISFYAYGRDDLILYTVLGVLVVALVLNLVLDPQIGIWGAGVALNLAYGLGSAARVVTVLRGFRRHARRGGGAAADEYEPGLPATAPGRAHRPG